MLTKNQVVLFLAVLWTTTCFGVARAEKVLSIHDLQYTEDPAGDSPYSGQTVDCAGGIVIHKYGGSRPRVILYDPAQPDGWGGIVVKDLINTPELFNQVAVGDWVSITNVEVEEFRGNTLLTYALGAGSGFSIQSSGNALPAPIVVTLGQIAAPLEDPVGSGDWYVESHSAERYEAMYLQVQSVTITAMDLGKAYDIYNLHNAEGDAWAADYINDNLTPGDDYMPGVGLGEPFVSISGILEQYTKTIGWDYYQLLTTGADDLVSPGPGDANLDGHVTDVDASILAAHWQTTSGAVWTNGDFNGDGEVNIDDALILAAHWQEGVEEGAASVPEPGAGVILVGGLLLVGLAALGRRKQLHTISAV